MKNEEISTRLEFDDERFKVLRRPRKRSINRQPTDQANLRCCPRDISAGPVVESCSKFKAKNYRKLYKRYYEAGYVQKLRVVQKSKKSEMKSER